MTWQIKYDGICPSTKHDGGFPSTNKTREEHDVGGSHLDRQHEVHLEQGFPRYCGNPGKRGCWGVTPWRTPWGAGVTKFPTSKALNMTSKMLGGHSVTNIREAHAITIIMA